MPVNNADRRLVVAGFQLGTACVKQLDSLESQTIILSTMLSIASGLACSFPSNSAHLVTCERLSPKVDAGTTLMKSLDS